MEEKRKRKTAAVKANFGGWHVALERLTSGSVKKLAGPFIFKTKRFLMFENNNCEAVKTMEALFKCPKCGTREKIAVPEKQCLVFHECKHCRKLIKAPAGECCVVCAYSDKKCPVSQRGD